MLDLIVEFFSLGLNTLDSARENEILLQLYQSCKQDGIYRCGEFDHIFQFQSWVCGCLYELSFTESFPWIEFLVKSRWREIL